jgi:beta-lactamase regulating signal transducer with metallopeptidase domain
MNTAFFSTSVVASWMFYSVFVGCAVSVAGLAGHDLLRSSNRPVRWIWIASIGVIVALTIAAPFRNRSGEPTADRKIIAVPSSASSARSALDDRRTMIVRARDAVIAPLAAALHRTQTVIVGAPVIVFQALIVSWVVASLTLICGFVLSYRRMMKHVRGLRCVEINGIAVHVSHSTGPAVVGLFPSKIIVSEWLIKRPVREQQIAVAHEMEHIRAADPWVLVVACSIVALMPWNPVLWYCLSRLRLAIEIDCDRRMVQRGVRIEKYGSLLIEISAVQRAMPLVSVAFPGSQSHLERRLIAMTERSVNSKWTTRVATAFVGVSALLAACESNLPTTAEIQHMDAAAVERHASVAGMLNGAPAKYVVDGKTVDAAIANALRPDEIASISVAKGNAGMPSEIRITTLPTLSPKTTAIEQSGAPAASTIRLRQAKEKSAFEGLLIVDGVIANASTLNTISPDRIASMEVLKSEAATTKYRDPRAAKGVILITTKP